MKKNHNFRRQKCVLSTYRWNVGDEYYFYYFFQNNIELIRDILMKKGKEDIIKNYLKKKNHNSNGCEHVLRASCIKYPVER